MKTIDKDIVVLSDAEHILQRPEMYVGSVLPTEERIPIIENNTLILKEKKYSVGMYKILDEVIDNALDEAKRCYAVNNPMKSITINFNSETNEVNIRDSGMGFNNPTAINTKTGVSNVETAMSVLRAGSNFNNAGTDVNLIGMHGIGVSCTNVLSEEFGIITTNKDIVYAQKWINFTNKGHRTKKNTNSPTGTYIKFIPRSSIFKDKWDKEIVLTKIAYLKLLQKYDESLQNIDIKIYFDDYLITDILSFFPNDTIELKNLKNLKVFSWPVFPNSTNISFVNGSKCTGIHQKIVQDYINEHIFDYPQAHYHYNHCIILDLPSSDVRFGDQNKTKFVSTRNELEPKLKFKFTDKQLTWIKHTEWYANVSENIDVTLRKGEIKKLKKAKKDRKWKVSEKYFPSKRKENLFLVEGLSASGSIIQKRNPMTDAVYALKGKIKNVRTIEDLIENKEIVDLMNILNLNLDKPNDDIAFKKIIIAADFDADGKHIATLIMNFFNKWFPNIINNGKLFILNVPLISIGKTKRQYFYSPNEFDQYKGNKSNVRYLKGLGSNDLKDWEYIFNDLNLIQTVKDKYADKMLNIAFGNNSNLRKQWLSL